MHVPSNGVYSVATPKTGPDGEHYFHVIGYAVAHPDGNGFNVVFESLPLPGEHLRMRPFKPDPLFGLWLLDWPPPDVGTVIPRGMKGHTHKKTRKR